MDRLRYDTRRIWCLQNVLCDTNFLRRMMGGYQLPWGCISAKGDDFRPPLREDREMNKFETGAPAQYTSPGAAFDQADG